MRVSQIFEKLPAILVPAIKPTKYHFHFCVDCNGHYRCSIPKAKVLCYLENAERCVTHYLIFIKEHGL